MKNINWKVILLLLVAMPIVNFLASRFGRTAAENVNSKEAKAPLSSPSNQEVKIIVSSQDGQGITQDQMDLDYLKGLEAYTLERVKVNTRKYLASKGRENEVVEATSDAIYAYSGSTKLAVIRIYGEGSRQVFIGGIVGREFKRVLCLSASSQMPPISYGTCGDKVKEVFGVRLDG
jgi:hypothetical protein